MHNVGFLQISHILIFSISFWPIQILMYGVLYWFWCTGIISRPNRLGVKNVLVVVRDPAVNWLLSCVMVKPSSNIILLEQDEHWSPFKSDLVNPPRWPPQRPWSPVAALWSLCLVFAVFTDLCWLCCVQWQCVDLVLCSSGIWFWEVQSSSWPPIQHSPQQGEEESRADSHWSTVFLLVARSVPLPPLSIMYFTSKQYD